MYFRDCKSLSVFERKIPLTFFSEYRFFPPISFLNISNYRLQPRLFMGWWKDVSNCLYWLHISGSRIMNMLAFSLWHYCLIDITHMWLPCALSHTLDLFYNFFINIIMWKKYWNLNYIVFSLNYLVFSLFMTFFHVLCLFCT